VSLKLRYDAERQVLASLGDPPNGLVCIYTIQGRVGFYVDRHWQPGSDKLAGGSIVTDPVPVRPEEGSELEVVEAVEACADSTAATALWMAAAGAMKSAVAGALHDGDLESVGCVLEFWGEVRDGLVEHGFLTVEGE
jgi:hypothetical protein